MRRLAWIAAGCLLAVALSSPPPAEARPYGAIAFDEQTGAWGVAYNQASQQAANAQALAECKKRGRGCDVVVRFWGELCAAYATGDAKTAGWGTGDTRDGAQRSAEAACQRQGRACKTRVWSCNARSGGNEAFTPTEMCHFWDSASQSYVTRFCSSR